MSERDIKPGVRVQWRGKAATVVSDYWRDRDRFSVQFDGDEHTLDFGAEALTLISQGTPA